MWEVQYHPAGVDRSPRFLFFQQRQVRWAAAGAVLLLLLFAAGMPLVPRAVRGVWVWAQVQELERERRGLLREKARLLAQRQRVEERLLAASGQLRRFALLFGQEPPELELGADAATLVAAAGKVLEEAEKLLRWAESHRELLASLPARSPLPAGEFEVSSLFGARVSPFTGGWEWHKGLDLAAPEGLPVRASGKGTVVFAGRAGMDNPAWARLGNAVVLQHAGLYLSVYAHLRQVLVREGQTVERGSVVGEVGNTGWSTAPHLHYEVRRLEEGGAVPVDPRFFMLDYPWSEKDRAVGGQGNSALDLLPAEKETLPWLKTKRSPR